MRVQDDKGLEKVTSTSENQKLGKEVLAMAVWKLKGCPRCGGDLFVENTSDG